MSFVRAAAVACALALTVGAVGCSDDGDDGATGATDSGCPVEPARVGELLGYEVVVDEDRATAEACRFEPADLRGDEGNGVDEGEPSLAGAHVLVVERRIAGSSDGRDGYTAAVMTSRSMSAPPRHSPTGSSRTDGAGSPVSVAWCRSASPATAGSSR